MAEIRVLLIDDEEEFVKTLAERLQMRNFTAQVALSGEQGLQVLHDWVPDVIVLDLKMPGMGGMEVLRRVKKTQPQVRVIILTGHGSDKDRDEALRLGAFEYLQKPVDISDLVQAVQRAYQDKSKN